MLHEEIGRALRELDDLARLSPEWVRAEVYWTVRRLLETCPETLTDLYDVNKQVFEQGCSCRDGTSRRSAYFRAWDVVGTVVRYAQEHQHG